MSKDQSSVAEPNPIPINRIVDNVTSTSKALHDDIISNPDRAFGGNARSRIPSANNGEEAAHFQPQRHRLSRMPT